MASSARRRAENGPGGVQWIALGGAVLVILGLTFALGLLVGRQWARQAATPVVAGVTEAARKPAAPPRRSGIAAETMADRAPESTEKLTFYKTLTEPLDGPAAPKPDAKPVAIKIPPALPSTPPPPAPAPAATVAAARPAPAPASQATQPPSLPPPPGKTADGGGAGASASAPVGASSSTVGPSTPYTIQVGAYKNRRQADDSRQQLASAGLDAYVVTLAAQEGVARYRVRVGTYRSREEAVAAAERLRAQRSLTTFVTPK
jgi:cell division protein FtsN